MIGLWEQHRYGEKVNGVTLRYPKYLAYVDLARQWNFSEEDMSEVRRLENIQQLGGDLLDEQAEFLKRLTARADMFDLYALAFPDGTSAREVREIVSKDKDGSILRALERICMMEMPSDVPAHDHVLAALMMGQCVVPLADQTVVQGLMLKDLMEESIKVRAEAVRSQQ